MTADFPTGQSIEQLADATAAGLAQAAAGSAFQLFGDKRFRRLARFEQLSQVEQDRIFNELVVASLVVIMLLLEAPDLRAAPEMQSYLAGLSKKIPGAYIDHLKTLGLHSQHLQDWDKLIAMRYEEYQRDKHEVRAAALRLESADKPLELDDLAKIQMLLPVHTVAIGCHHHICRGSTEGREELFKSTLNSLAQFYVELRVRFEGGNITTLSRARFAVRHWLRRIGKK